VHRTSRHVELTELGKRFQDRLVLAHIALVEALDDVKNAARHPVGRLRIGLTVTTLEKVAAMADAFEARYGDSEVELREVSIVEPYAPLRRGRVDVLVNWRPVDEPDLTVGPVLDRMDRFLAVAATHPLAERTSVSVEDLADYQVRANPQGVPQPMWEAIIPSDRVRTANPARGADQAALDPRDRG
jgi:DNA-binding transcriptional LysR family regulator